MTTDDYGPEQYVNFITAVTRHWGADYAPFVDCNAAHITPASAGYTGFVLTDISREQYAFRCLTPAPIDPVLFRTPGEWGMLWAFKPGMFIDKSVLYWPMVLPPSPPLVADTWPQPWRLINPAMMSQGIVFDPIRCAYLWNDYMSDPEGTRAKHHDSIASYIFKHRPAA